MLCVAYMWPRPRVSHRKPLRLDVREGVLVVMECAKHALRGKNGGGLVIRMTERKFSYSVCMWECIEWGVCLCGCLVKEWKLMWKWGEVTVTVVNLVIVTPDLLKFWKMIIYIHFSHVVFHACSMSHMSSVGPVWCGATSMSIFRCLMLVLLKYMVSMYIRMENDWGA